MNKDYKIWTPIKIKTNKNLARPPKFYAGQVWDCIVGENIGVESDGKNSSFIRPVLIVKRFGASAFLGVPLTSQPKPARPYYFPTFVANRHGFLLFSQLRTWDASRLVRRIDKLKKDSFGIVRQALSEYLDL